MTPTSTELRDRWLTPEWEPVARQVADIILGDGSLANITLRTDEGRIDLRGYQFPTPPTRPWGVWNDELIEQLDGFIELNDTALHDIDFSHASMPHWRAMNAEFVNCVLDGAHCPDWRIWQTDLTDCSLRKTNLRGSMLGTMWKGRPNIWTRCDLTGADLRDCDLSDSDVYDCDFSNARIQNFTARHTTWERCTFSGVVASATFDGCPGDPDAEPGSVAQEWWMTDVDFSTCTFDDVTIDNYDLTSVSLPTGTVRIPDGPGTWAAAATHLEAMPPAGARDAALPIARYFSEPRPWTDGDAIYAPLGDPLDGPLTDALVRAGAHQQ